MVLKPGKLGKMRSVASPTEQERKRALAKVGARRRLLARYGMTEEAFEAMRKAQGNRCAICRREFTRTPNIDHDHKTGRVRGLVDFYCNLKFLGPLERGGIERLRRAIPYLGWKL